MKRWMLWLGEEKNGLRGKVEMRMVVEDGGGFWGKVGLDKEGAEM